MRILRLLDDHFEEWLLIGSLAFSVALVFTQVIARYVFQSSLSWSEELARYIFVWQIWVGASMAVKYNKHIKVEFLRDLMPPRIKWGMNLAATLIWVVMSAELAWMGTQLALILMQRGQLSPAMRIPMAYAYWSVPVGCGLMTIRLLQQLCGMLRAPRETTTGEGRG